MGKSRRSVSIDEDLDEQLTNRESINASAVINELLRQYLAGGEAADVALKLRKRDLQQQKENKQVNIQRLESEVERLDREIDDIDERIRKRRQDAYEEVETIAERIRDGRFDRENLSADNPAIQNYAQKAQMSPERFVSEVRDNL